MGYMGKRGRHINKFGISTTKDPPSPPRSRRRSRSYFPFSLQHRSALARLRLVYRRSGRGVQNMLRQDEIAGAVEMGLADDMLPGHRRVDIDKMDRPGMAGA